MVMDLRRARLKACSPCGGRAYIGGSSKSSQSTTNTDARVVGGNDSNNLSQVVYGSGNKISTTDHGAVSGSLKLALAGVEGAQQIAREAQEASGELMSGTLRMVGQQQQQFTEAVEKIKTADVRVIIVAGLAVVGLAAATALKKG